jgi:hypothetical protein
MSRRVRSLDSHLASLRTFGSRSKKRVVAARRDGSAQRVASGLIPRLKYVRCDHIHVSDRHSDRGLCAGGMPH